MMAGHAIDPLAPSVRALLRRSNTNWSLVIGAGVTIGLLPSWRELSRGILEITTRDRITEAHFDQLVHDTAWHFDTWIQAALNAWLLAGGSDATFADQLERIIYSDLRAAARSEGLESDLVRAFYDPNLLRRSRRIALTNFLEARYPHSSAVQLASVLASSSTSHRAPAAILTFSYDTVLETLIRLDELIDGSPPAFYRITRPAALYLRDRIPIFHLHGCLLPKPGDREKKILRIDSRERLVAPESSYTQIAGSLFAWSQNTFLHFAQSTNLLILGHSLSDPNLRRWLAWTSVVRKQQVPKPIDHLWLRKAHESATDKNLIEQSVRHLGVRVAWLKTWDDVPAALRNLIGIDPAEATTA